MSLCFLQCLCLCLCVEEEEVEVDEEGAGEGEEDEVEEEDVREAGGVEDEEGWELGTEGGFWEEGEDCG